MSDPDASLWRVLTATTTTVPRPPGFVDQDGAQQEEARFCRHGGLQGKRCDESDPDALETEIYAQARRGLRALSGAAVLVLLTIVVVNALAKDALGWNLGAADTATARLRQVALLVLSALMFAFTLRKDGCPRTVARLGHGYQLLGAFIISLSVYGTGRALPPTDWISWLGVWIVVFPLVTPACPRIVLGLSLGCAGMAPLVLIGSGLLRGTGFPAPELLFQATTPYFACVGLAVVPALILQRISRSLSEQRHALEDLGTYELVEPLGRGGMGEVWRAEHRLLKRPAAIKVIRPQRMEGSTPAERENLVARFEREATTTASLRSPHTIDLYDFGVTEDRAFYYVMELLEGVDLEQLIRAIGPLPPARAVFLLRQVCASLAEAHARGMVHRDLKPANIMVCRMGLQTDFIKVLDFGLVRAVEDAKERERVDLTGADAIVGTPAFMAPEQAQGGEVTARSDVYALGCVAYWLVTGELVFEQTKALAMILDHVKTEPTPPSKRLERLLPPDLEDLILQCLAKEPADRPASAQELIHRLEALELGESWTAEQSDAWWAEFLPPGGTVPADPSAERDAARVSTLLMGA
ncbi:MAG TPA: serine/threonine protein kinase [Planctomycetes bacterium]|nr:serine/threonine protein kinase [Planctomycetota bacterium]